MEGSIKQIKNVLKNFLVVKPACLFDTKIDVGFKVSYFENGKYNEKNVREVKVSLA